MDWGWIKDVSWIGTAVVALGGLGATVWTARRSGQVQLTVQEKQLQEGRRVLEWQERRAAYAQFLRQFQEWVDKYTIQTQLNSVIDNALPSDMSTRHPSILAIMASDMDESLKDQAINEVRDSARVRMQEEFGMLTMREGWLLESQVEDAATQARLLAPGTVREALDVLMKAASKEKISEAVKVDGVRVFEARVARHKAAVTQLMSEDLLQHG